MIMKVELTQSQVDLLISMNAIFTEKEGGHYYRLPWVKLEIGSNMGEFYINEAEYPEDLKKVLADEAKME